MKKAFAAALCALMLFTMLPFGVGAEEEDKQPFSLRETVIQQAHDSYYKSRATAGKRSFHGKCGLLVGHQLYNLRINKKCVVFDGNDNYDYYSSKEQTSGGYYITSYSAAEYNLEEALLAVSSDGTRDVMNILVGFQWTNTDAGRKYGHAMFINGIVGGKVYFVESFSSSVLGGAEGTVLSCSIKEFAKYYDKWTRFEGIVHFGTGTYHDICPNVPTDLIVQTRFPTVLRSEPAVVGQQGCVRLRSVAAGERLRATAIYEAEHAYYYLVETNEGYGFISAGAASFLQVNTEGMELIDYALPNYVKLGDIPDFSGAITDQYGTLSSIEVCITDSRGELVRRELVDIQEKAAQLEDLRNELFFDLLEPGNYRVEIYASRACPAVSGGDTADHYLRILLDSRVVQVEEMPNEKALPEQTIRVVRDGWFRENGLWYFYQEGKPVTGWVMHLGVRYYLQSDGAITTGVREVDGKSLYFSKGGALVTGWLNQEGKTGYREEDGTAVTGWQTIEGALYCFDENGVMLTDMEQMKDGITYLIAKNGMATAKETEETQNGK